MHSLVCTRPAPAVFLIPYQPFPRSHAMSDFSLVSGSTNCTSHLSANFFFRADNGIIKPYQTHLNSRQVWPFSHPIRATHRGEARPVTVMVGPILLMRGRTLARSFPNLPPRILTSDPQITVLLVYRYRTVADSLPPTIARRRDY